MSDKLEGLHESFLRAYQLELNPIAGKFDAEHLRRIHGHLFQDCPEFGPGRFREPQPEHPHYAKNRVLESRVRRHSVYYMPHDFAARVGQVLKDFGGAAALRGLSLEQAAGSLAQLYGDLDHAHPFAEGNSRTLRAFTAQMAREAGFRLDWGASNADAFSRDRLYIARDVAVTQRAFPGLASNNVHSLIEERAYINILFRYAREPTLRDVIAASLTMERD
jgi:cell filamentation protein